jgi:glutamate synthase domain-containing protein 3
LDNGTPVVIETEITNLNRTFGTMLSYNVSKKYGKDGLPDDTIQIKLKGHGGQSFGFTLAKGITATIEGDANDYTGKGLSGGKIAVYPAPSITESGFQAENNVIVGNVCLYGATSGKAFFRGKAGERFCVRNSGALAVVEGCGDHGAEYMTGGRLVILGDTGRNFAAGMSGGIAYIYDPNGKFPERCNMGLVGLEAIDSSEEIEELQSYIKEHVAMTGSTVGKTMLDNWDSHVHKFVKVMPHDYKRVLMERAARAAQTERVAA